MTKNINTTLNQPLAYDYHGELPLNTNFNQINPQEIDIYLDLDTTIGSDTCGQNCQHCWFVNYKIVKDKSFKEDSGIKIYESLKKQNFNVYPRYTDSFSYKGDFIKLFGSSRNRSFKEGEKINTKTMEKGEAWTSGKPLLVDEYEELLDLARDYNYGTIAITFHGILDEDLNIQKEYPIKGTFHGLDTIKVINRIKYYNSKQQDNKFRIAIGITVGKHNNSKESLLRYIEFFNNLGIDSLRFNNFYNHGYNYPNLVLEKKELEEIYTNFSFIHKNIELDFQLGVSQDFGTYNVEVMKYPKNVEDCKAGIQLFAVIPNDEIVETNDGHIIGTVVGCVNTFEPKLGKLYRTKQDKEYRIDFDYNAIEKLQKKRTSGIFTNGCFSKELDDAIVKGQY